MGGSGSGPQWGNGRPLVEECLCLDCDFLAREGLLRPGRWGAGSFKWLSSDGEVPVEFELDLREERFEHIRLFVDITNNGGPIESWIYLKSVKYRWGGQRWYFRAPFTGRRVSKLYLHRQREARAGFRDRRDVGLAYQSQRLSWQDRLRRRRQLMEMKLERRGVNPRTQWPRKPKGMHWRTFRRLQAERREAIEGEDLVFLTPLLGLIARTRS